MQAARPAATRSTSPRTVIFDDAKDGKSTTRRPVPRTWADTRRRPDKVVAVIGPLNSSVAKVQIPMSNAAGLLQCSPANTNEGLTKPEFGALDIRKANPTKINYVRVVTTDDNQGPAAAKYILEVLGKKKVYIIDSTDTFGKGIADNFQKYLEANGGTTVARDGAPKGTSDYSALMTAAARPPSRRRSTSVASRPTAVRGSSRLRSQAGMADVPFVGPDGIYDGSAATKDSFLNLAGDDAKTPYATAAAVGDFPGRQDFADALQGRVRHGSDRLQRDGLRLRAGRHRRPQPGGAGDRHEGAPRGRPCGGRRHDPQVRHR